MTDRDLTWKALADPTRREILDALADGPQTTGELVERNRHHTRHLADTMTPGLVTTLDYHRITSYYVAKKGSSS